MPITSHLRQKMESGAAKAMAHAMQGSRSSARGGRLISTHTEQAPITMTYLRQEQLKNWHWGSMPIV